MFRTGLAAAACLALAAAFAHPAHAQSTADVQLMCKGSNGVLTPCSASNPLPTGNTSSAASKATTQTAVTCGTTSSTAYTGGSATNGFVRFKVQEGGSTSVYFSWIGGTANTTSGELLGTGESVVWGPLSNSVTCITASGTATVIVTQ